jgi:hypothetical protein
LLAAPRGLVHWIGDDGVLAAVFCADVAGGLTCANR